VGARFFDVSIFNEIRAQDKIYILVGTAWLKYFTYQLVPVGTGLAQAV
jgi:hypothetical protein